MKNKFKNMLKNILKKTCWLWLVLLLGASLGLACLFGVTHIAAADVWQISWAKFLNQPTSQWTLAEVNIVWNLRVPRVLLGALVGGGLALVGAVLQAIVHNPLADPYLFGISAGASAAAVATILYVGVATNVWALPLAAFCGGLLAILTILLLVRQLANFNTTSLILAGISVSFLFSAATQFLLFSSGQRGAVSTAIFWTLGGLGNAEWYQVGILGGVLFCSLLVAQTFAPALNILALGEETALSLGVRPNQTRWLLFIISAGLTGVLVAFSGVIGFVGLMLPHITRWLIGADYRFLLPAATAFGACFLVWVDVLARTVLSPQELPIGIFTALLGALFLMFLLRRKTQI